MKKSKKNQKKFPLKKIIAGIVAFLIAIFSGAGIGIVIKPTDGGISIETTFGMQIAEKQMPAELELIDGEKIIDEDIVTIEEVTSNQLAECNEGEECGQGRFIYAPTDTPAKIAITAITTTNSTKVKPFLIDLLNLLFFIINYLSSLLYMIYDDIIIFLYIYKWLNTSLTLYKVFYSLS